MSYDVTIMGKECPTCGHSTDAYEYNHTSNTSGMWCKAGCDLAEFHGKQARDLAKSLKQAIAKMRASPGDYTSMETKNGWGTYGTTLLFLTEILEACERNPDGVVDVDR